MTLSVNTNVGAMAALQNLTSTNSSMQTVQSRINTGLAVAGTKDDSAAYNIAQGLRGDVGGISAVTSSLNNAKSVTDVAVSGAEQISDILNQMKTLALKANDATLTTEQSTQYDTDFGKLVNSIKTIINSSSFNGTNLLKSDGGSVSALESLQGGSVTGAGSGASAWNPTQLTVANQGLSLDSGSVLTFGASASIGDASSAVSTLAQIETSAKNLQTTLSDLGAASREIDRQLTFNSKLSDTLTSGIGNLVDADLAKESANLQSLQVKQQLGTQALSIANQAPQTILSLFR
jgi:flagellin